jgi:hypothetical protein
MSHQINEIIDFLREETGYQHRITDTTSLDKDLKICGDDHHNLMEQYAKKFNVDMSQYLWYFHTEEESISLGSLFFKPPHTRVEHIGITVTMLLQNANTGKWSLPYPEHHLPKHRYDLIMNAIIGISILLFGAWFVLYQYSPS